jgi:hypothetical protein
MNATLERKWTIAYASFDMNEKPWRIESSDTQLDWLLVLVGAKRSSYWDGTDWTYCERDVKRMSKSDASTAMVANKDKWKWTRLVAQPKEFFDLPSCRGWMDCWQEETVPA